MARVYNSLFACEVWYPLDGGIGNIVDISGHPARSLQSSGGPVPISGPGGTLLPGRQNLATDFNGSSQSATETPIDLITDISTLLSICFWYKTSTPNQTSTYIFTYRNVPLNTDNFAIIFGFTANKFALYTDAGGNSSGSSHNIATTATLTDSLWHHWAVTYDGANIRWYKDGIIDSTSAATWSYGSGSNTTNRTLWLMQGSGATGFNKGTLRDFRIYSRTLNPGEVLMISREPYNLIFPIAPMHVATAASAVFRKTFSPIGTRTGSRQAQGFSL